MIKLFEIYECPNEVYLVQELCSGGELFDRIIKNEYLNEAQASKIFSQILHSVLYCHKNKICHRDLKPENFMFQSESDDSFVKLIDFGLSRSYYKYQSGS